MAASDPVFLVWSIVGLIVDAHDRSMSHRSPSRVERPSLNSASQDSPSSCLQSFPLMPPDPSISTGTRAGGLLGAYVLTMHLLSSRHPARGTGRVDTPAKLLHVTDVDGFRRGLIKRPTEILAAPPNSSLRHS